MIWRDKEGKIVSCIEKIKVLNQNLQELYLLSLTFAEVKLTPEYQYALEDAILFGINTEYFETVLADFIKEASSTPNQLIAFKQ
jgi:hypothetical protein